MVVAYVFEPLLAARWRTATTARDGRLVHVLAAFLFQCIVGLIASPLSAAPTPPSPQHVPSPINFAELKITSVTPNPTVGQPVTVGYQINNVGFGLSTISGSVFASFNGQLLKTASSATSTAVAVAPRGSLTGTFAFTPTSASSDTVTVTLNAPPQCTVSTFGQHVPCRVAVLATVSQEITIIQPIVHVRIAGVTYANIKNKDSQDTSNTNSEWLYVFHNPGCGWWGNSATDKFFNTKSLPPGASLEGVDYAEFWPNGINPSNAGGNGLGTGTYGATFHSTPFPQVNWRNTCSWSFADKNVDYAISFRVAMPAGTDLGEPYADASIQPGPPITPPGHSIIPGNGGTSNQPIYFTLANGGVSFTNTFGSQAGGTITGIANGEDETIILLASKNLNNGCGGSGNVTLTAHEVATAAQMKTLYGSSTPPYPLKIGACLDRTNDGSKLLLAVVVTYYPS